MQTPDRPASQITASEVGHGKTSRGADPIDRERHAPASSAASTCDELRRALAGDEQALAALYRLEVALMTVRSVVERYGRVWAKDTDYYDAAEVLGIKEPPC